jgi:intracellular sulfur oxidation DsrE/DsrF family protein
MKNIEIDNLDVAYFEATSDATTFDELRDYIDEQGGFEVEIIYYGSAIEYLQEHDTSLRWSLELADRFDFTLGSLSSEVLASLVASEKVREDFNEYEDEINEYYESLNTDEL